jgi:hypothetical protein
MVKSKKASGAEGGEIRLTGNDGASPVDLNDNEAVTRYLVDMIDQLEAIARLRKHDLLAYLLAMAGVQAGSMEPGPNVVLRKRSVH